MIPCCAEELFEHVLCHVSLPSASAPFVTFDDHGSSSLSCCCAHLRQVHLVNLQVSSNPWQDNRPSRPRE
jgi:hypothetical protein